MTTATIRFCAFAPVNEGPAFVDDLGVWIRRMLTGKNLLARTVHLRQFKAR